MSLIYGGSLTLGGTINIGSYENIKVELSGAIRDEADLEGLVVTLQTALERIGREDPQVRTAIDSFARRVLGSGESSSPGIPEGAGPVRTPVYPGIPPTEGKLAPAVQGPLGSPCNRADCDLSATCDRKPATCQKLGKDSTPPEAMPAAPRAPEPPANTGLGRFAKAAPAAAPTTKETHVPPPSTPAAPSTPKAAPKMSGAVCEDCGAEVTQKQKATSTLFVSKILCEDCVKALTDAIPGDNA